MATSTFGKKIVVKGTKAVDKFYKAMKEAPASEAPKHDIEKEIKEGMEVFQRYLSRSAKH